MPFYREHSDTIFLSLRIHPSAPDTTVTHYDSDYLYVRVAAVPENGKANKELIKFLSKTLKKRKEEIRIVVGEFSHVKIIRISNTRADELLGAIEQLNLLKK